MFNLLNYLEEIKSVATENKVSNSQAVEYFLINLTVMKEQYKGASQLNYHQIGQQWNKLGYKQKRDQKQEAIKMLTNSRRSMDLV